MCANLENIALTKSSDSNLYIGTSASEILHFVQIPPDPEDSNGQPSYILASRLSPQGESTNSPDKPGVQQILLLPTVQKSLVLCNGTITFYSLPELSPIFENIPPPKNCGWVGGIDLNIDTRTIDHSPTASVTALISLKSKLRPVIVGERARGLKTIDYTGSIISVRRDSIACVADSRSYALLDIDQQLKIPLFPVSSLDITLSDTVGGRVEDISSDHPSDPRIGNVRDTGHLRTHSRDSSLGTLINAATNRASSASRDRTGPQTPDRISRVTSPAPTASPTRSATREPDTGRPDTSSVSAPASTAEPPAVPEPDSSLLPVVPPDSVPASAPVYLKPHIISPSPQEFLLVTGTAPSEPGVGMFVNLDGDVTRSTLEFERYPHALVADGRGQGIDFNVNNAEEDEEGYIIAVMSIGPDNSDYGLEIQRWDLDPGEGALQKSWLSMPATDSQPAQIDRQLNYLPGVRSVTDKGDIQFAEVIDKLSLKRFRPSRAGPANVAEVSIEQEEIHRSEHSEDFESSKAATPPPVSHGEFMSEDAEQLRIDEEVQFAKRLALTRTRIVVWSEDKAWWVVRNPLTLRLDAGLPLQDGNVEDTNASHDRQAIVETINSIRGQEARTEVEFVGLGYIRQKAGMLLLIDLLRSDIPALDAEDRIAEEALMSSGLDPRIVLSLVPTLKQEIVEGKNGIWLHGGVLRTTETFLASSRTSTKVEHYILQFYRRYLTAWRLKKGFGSIASEREVFQSLDAALLVVLLELDKSAKESNTARSPLKGSVRYELYSLVDNGIECFDRATQLLEHYGRLYVLSRLYQSRKMAAEVLHTWRRIVEDATTENKDEFPDGEQEFRKYLTKISNPRLVEEYGVWLAARNTRLGIQVFADDKARVRFEPAQVVEILRKGAPSAIKEYLEYLVFVKNHTQHVNELISYYLDIVVATLTASQEAKDILEQSYSTYRALDSPKPTYRQFITDNAIPDEWWHARLRLLQLLGGSHGAASEYDVDAILHRIEPFTKYLVPEIIILQGRRGMHVQALKLLVHDLGDYDTAISYCLLGGSSIYHPVRHGEISHESVNASDDLGTNLRTPNKNEQTSLFNTLLSLFLELQDISDRVNQTTYLLSHHSEYFDITEVLAKIPDDWSLDLVSGFLITALRKIVVEKRATGVVKAISGAENLAVSIAVADSLDKRKAVVQRS